MSLALPETFEEDRWVPPPDLIESYRVTKFLRHHGLANYRELSEKASAEPTWFYPAALEFLSLPWMRPWDSVLDESDGRPFAHWFKGGQSNLAWLVAQAWPDSSQPAIIWDGEDGTSATLTAGELEDLTSRAAAGLRHLGVGKGDAVALYLPMIPEAAVAMLAVARIGAIAVPAFSGYGVDALAERLELGEARVVITADGFLRRGKVYEMLPNAVAAAGLVESVRHCVVISRLGHEDATATDEVVPWDELLSHGQDGDAQPFDAEHPWLLAFTSGSTGRPKGAVHTHGGFPYSAAIEFGFAFDVQPGDRLCWPSDLGWMVGPVTIAGCLALGAAVVLVEGAPDYPEPDRLWRLVDSVGITQIGIAPTLARMMAEAGDEWVDKYDLGTLRVIGSTGEPSSLTAWRWLHRHVGRGTAPIINWAGGTEVGGGIVCGSPACETQACGFSGPTLGMQADVFDQDGRSVTGEIGELVVRGSWPAMTRGFWKDSTRYLEAYWSRFPDTWLHGDRAIKYPDGTWEVPGRSDDLLKIAGKRLGPTELESLALDISGVVSAAAVAVPHPTKGHVPVIAITTAGREDHSSSALTSLVSERIEAALGKAFRPHAVVVLEQLPLTRSDKIHRRVLRAWLSGEDPGDTSSLGNPESERFVQEARIALGLA